MPDETKKPLSGHSPGSDPKAVGPEHPGSQNLVRMSTISLALDDYNDIFSDFDPRPYSQRALSEDFLQEAKNASRDKVSGEIVLTFLVPAAKRYKSHEAVIKKRLREHFNKHHQELKKKKKDVIVNQGMIFIILGIFIMLTASVIVFEHLNEQTLFVTFLVVMMEPAGWFLFWEGLHVAIFESKKMNPDLHFYEKMSRCGIQFFPY